MNLRKASTTFIYTVLCMTLSTAVACAQDKGKDMTTFRMTLDGNWMFRIDPEKRGESEQWFSPSQEHDTWDTLAVPGFWDALRDYASFDGYGWYARRFDLRRDAAKKYALQFEAVDDHADVWVNGRHVGGHVGYGMAFTIDVTDALRNGENVIAVRVEDVMGPGGLMGSVTLRSYRNELDLMTSPFHELAAVESADWVRDAVIYELFPRVFSEEGSFRAIERRLPELQELGATVLWLMPIHPIGEKKRKGSLGSPYAVQDYYAVNPEYGTLEDFRSLVDAVHARGMHIIIDLVINHTAWDNPLIEQHPEWYSTDAEGNIAPPNPGWYDVADLDFDHPEVRAYMRDMMLHWVRDVGVDGYRCDVAELVPMDFWSEVIDTLRGVKPVMMLAEGAKPELHQAGFDLTYAWNVYDVLAPIVRGDRPASALTDVMQREFYRYQRGALRLRFTTNHDKNKEDGPPVLHLGLQPAQACAVYVHLLPGVPLIYNGQESGSARPLELFDMEKVDWEDDHGFRELYTDLNRLRAGHAALRRGRFEQLDVEGAAAVEAYARHGERETCCVAVNFSQTPVQATLSLPDACRGERLLGDGNWVVRDGMLRLTLPPWGYIVLR